MNEGCSTNAQMPPPAGGSASDVPLPH